MKTISVNNNYKIMEYSMIKLFFLILIGCLCCVSTIYSLQTETPSDLLHKVNIALQIEKDLKTTIRNCSQIDNIDCSYFKYRSVTGICNNLLHKNAGARGDVFIRLSQPDYSNGFSTPRNSKMHNNDLPNADYVAEQIVQLIADQVVKKNANELLPAWGNFISQDLTDFTVVNSLLDCCTTKQNKLNNCYVSNTTNCKDYKRTSPAIDEIDCTKYERNQMNAVTGFLDASNIYTSEDYLDNGLISLDITSEADRISGDINRLFIMEHNRIALKLSEINPSWSDRQTYYESRKIIIALLQHITFSEFLPVVLGDEVLNNFQLSPHDSLPYLDTKRPGVYNEFAIIASTIFKSILSENTHNIKDILQSKVKFNALHWMAKSSDKFSEFGYAIHQARDHGIPAYLRYLNICTNQNYIDKADLSFNDITNKLNISFIDSKIMSIIYKNPNDIDMIVGAMLENISSASSLFGPTLTCIMAKQFQHIKQTDRYWYENDGVFSQQQLDNIRNIRLSTILCKNTELNVVNVNSFLTATEDNHNINCQELPELNLNLWRLKSKKSHEDKVNKSVLLKAIKKAEDEVFMRNRNEYLSWIKYGGVDAKSPDGTAASFSKANKNAILMANTSLLYEFASKEILNSIILQRRRKRQIQTTLDTFNQNHLLGALETLDVSKLIAQKANLIKFDEQCEDTFPCNTNTAFRTLSGRCNNVENGEWGQSLTTFSRLLAPQYEDGISKPRSTSVSGSLLPNPRTISTLIHPDISHLHSRYSLMVMQYAQFLDHDLTLTPIHKGFHESIPSCRKCNSPQTVHPECNPFPVPPGDHYYPEVNITSGEQLCFPFMRSLPGQQILGPRQQTNQNTAYLDSSQVYGENNCVAIKLRGFSGRLNSTIPNKGKELLPQSPFHPECKSLNGLCFIGGDERASEQPGLTAIHTIFLREHNRIVEGLRGVNPHWNGDQLYEQARKIVMAQNQHITYNEFLPRILSWNAVNLYGLKLLSTGYYKEYNPQCNAAIFNEFAAAAFRIGHSLLRPHIPRLNANHHPVDPPLLLRDGFFKMDALLQPGIIDEISRGLIATPMESLDQFITGEVTNHLFEDRRIPFSGIDLIALNIQRGRDHGLPSYNNYRALCNLKRARTWQDLDREIPPEVITRFKKIYQSVEDIDLFPGAMAERPLQGGLVGPTLACIIGIQFRQLRKCDRFWYENNGFATRFNEAQLAEIRKSSLAKIICENLEIQGDIQRSAFDLPTNFLNPRESCLSLPQIDLGKWRETIQECTINGRNIKIGESAFPSPCTSCICTPEGSQCASLRVTDCARLEKEWTREEIQRDEICNSQCGEFLQNNSKFTRIVRSLANSAVQFSNLTDTS